MKEVSTVIMTGIITLSVLLIPSPMMAEENDILIEGNITWEGEMLIEEDILVFYLDR